MNLPATQNAQLPAHLQQFASNPAFSNLNASAAAGISSGGWPRILSNLKSLLETGEITLKD